MAKDIYRPRKGIDVDSAFNVRDNDNLYMAKNLRPNSAEELNLGQYTNIKGPNVILNSTSTYSIIKIHKILDNIILFVKKTTYPTTDILCLIKESALPLNGEGAITLVPDQYYWSGFGTGHKIISGDFGFDVDEKIQVKSYYEGSETIKIYWTTAGEPLRALNIIYTSGKNDPSAYSASDLIATPNSDLSIPVINQTVSGNLLCGKIYYAYKLVNSIGAETALSELSFPFHLTKSNDNLSTDYDYKGYGFDVNSDKGTNITISSIDSSFSRVKVYSIHYIDDVSLPVIKLIYDNSATDSLTINDTGNAILELSAEEFIAINNLYSINGQLEIKNNHLFIANYTEEYFDIDEVAPGGYWDARAYRFSSTPIARIYDVDFSTHIDIDNSSVNYEDVPTDHDCAVFSNDISRNLTDIYKYQSDGSTMGASGLNITITQINTGGVHPDYSNENIKWYAKKASGLSAFTTKSYDNYSNPIIDSRYKSFIPEEVYRLGIQFKRSRGGQYSYPKWICDYKYNYDYNIDMFVYYGGKQIGFRVQNLSFTVSNIPTDPDTGAAYEWRIVYVPITDTDRSVYWGLFNTLHKSSSTDTHLRPVFLQYYSNDHEDGSSYVSKNLEFVSPNYCIGDKNDYKYFKIFKYGDIVDVQGGYTNKYKALVYKIYDWTTNADSSRTEVVNQYDIDYNIDIEEEVSLDGSNTLHRTAYSIKYDSGYTDPDVLIIGYANKGRCQIIAQAGVTPAYDKIYWGCTYVDNFTSRYGGASYEARQNNGYIPLSSFTNTTKKVYGDAYLGLFEYLRLISENTTTGYVHDQNKWAMPEILIFPAITNINLALRSDDFFTKIYTKNSSYAIHEYSGVYETYFPNDGDATLFTQETDLYLYNNTYSRKQDLFKHYPKQDISSTSNEFNARIIASQNKIIGEQSDSFLKIQPSNYIDVDGQYGEIKLLKVFNDRLFFFQQNAFGVVSTNEKASTSTTDGSTLIVGEIGLLARRDYISIKNGISSDRHVCTTNTGLYIIDSVRKQLLRFGDGLEKISITKNVDSLTRVKDWENGFVMYNRKYDEVLFFYYDTSWNALVYNERIQQFTGIYTYADQLLDSVEINREDLYDELVLNNSEDLMVLNDGNYNRFSFASYPSEITFLISTKDESIVLYNVIEFILEQFDSGMLPVDFMSSIRFQTKTQDSGWLGFSSNTKLKFGKYRTNKLRDYADTNSRILSDHLYVTIKTGTNSRFDGGLGHTVYDNYRVFFRDLIVNFTEYNWFE